MNRKIIFSLILAGATLTSNAQRYAQNASDAATESVRNVLSGYVTNDNLNTKLGNIKGLP